MMMMIKLQTLKIYNRMELDITYAVPEWKEQDIRIVLEEKVVFTTDGLIFPGGPRKEYHIIK